MDYSIDERSAIFIPEIMRILQPGQMMPDFSLPSTLGRPIRVSDFRNRSNLVLVFCRSANMQEIDPLLTNLNTAFPDISAENTFLAAILPVDIETAGEIVDRLDLNYPLLADAQGRILSEQMQISPSGVELYILDRYGEIASMDKMETIDHFPNPVEILDWVRFLEIQCPE